uniref:Mucin like 3 n=1 Tax=Ursus maritimus TaxID=29073 RepID=A0A452V1V0_URSMA
MAQPAHCIHSSFGLQCCLLVLLASWEAGAVTFQEFQKTHDSPASDHLFAPKSGLVYSTPSDRTALHSGHNPLDLSKSTETHKVKRHCNNTQHILTTYKPIRNSPNSTSHHEVPSTSRKNRSNQGKDPNVQNGGSLDPTDSTNTHKGLSGAKSPIPTTKNKRACTKPNTNKTGTGNQHKTVTSSRNINIKSATSHKTLSPVHNLVSPESNKMPTSSSGRSKTATKVSHEATRTPERSKRAEDHNIVAGSRTTVASGKTVMHTREHINRTTSVIEKTTLMPATLRVHRHRTTLAHINITRTLENPPEDGKRTTLANGKTTGALEGSKDHGEKTTGALEGSKDHGEKTTGANEKITQTSAKSTKRDKSVTNTSPDPNKTDVTYEVPSFTLTKSHMELSFTRAKTPGNKSHPYQNKDGSQRGLHAGGMRDNDSFPAWAIVIVVLVAVILFLMFLGLIFLISYMTKTRHALIQNKEDNDPEDDGGPNSYPVHLMQQQTLGMGQIASPR